jgi:hypothetical protein
MVPTHRSANAFERADRIGVLMLRTPSARNAASKPAVNLISLSRIKNLAMWSATNLSDKAGFQNRNLRNVLKVSIERADTEEARSVERRPAPSLRTRHLLPWGMAEDSNRFWAVIQHPRTNLVAGTVVGDATR